MAATAHNGGVGSGTIRRWWRKEVWPGIDVEYRVQPEGVETLFRVQPGADVSQIRVEYEGLDAPLAIDSRGNLVLQTSLGRVHEKAPYAYQSERRRQVDVPVRFKVLNDSSYAFSISEFKTDRELVIDPLLYGTFLGGASIELVYDVAQYPDGGFVVCGTEVGQGFPITPSAYQENADGAVAFVTRFSSEGDSLVFSTFVGAPPPFRIRTETLKRYALIMRV